MMVKVHSHCGKFGKSEMLKEENQMLMKSKPKDFATE